MALSNRIIRGDRAKVFESWEFKSVGKHATSPVERLFNELGVNQPKAAKVIPPTPEEQRLLDWQAALQAREKNIAALEKAALEKATEEGMQKGYDAGWDAAHNERTQLIHAIQTVHQEFEKFKASLGDKVLDLASVTARKILGDTVATDKRAAGLLLMNLIHELNLDPAHVTLCANAQTLKAIDAHFGDRAELAGIKLREDNSLLNAGFTLNHPEGMIDARMETRWQRVIENLGSDLPLAAEHLPDESPDQAVAEEALVGIESQADADAPAEDLDRDQDGDLET